ncbi:asparagine synthase C-terminal domain-containing protein [Pseudomonas fontis]|uniref:Asparagine synthase C-terminal domain-containing protein n=1 Tax=Pseudomonas fontis TaxID=2942633 RepID=A0ABT5NYV5_9PSED|nr:asparagine synthase-related protein [Pseudomonas fontis]MDD0976702.1 asparagine synthase C-terminal domain-containing protein [Pseudomonas fontis]MDD0993307.1 asparagine synthase C-terminal domain-containing protein [Pseudomonas fontis]
MTQQPWLLLSSRPITQLEDAHLPLTGSAFHGYANAWPTPVAGDQADALGRPCTRLVVGGDNTLDVQGNKLTVETSSRNITPLYWSADHRGNFIISTDLLIAASAWVNLTDCQLSVRENAGVHLGDHSSIHGLTRLQHSNRLEVVLQGNRTHIECCETFDSLALQSARFNTAVLAGEAQLSALEHSIADHLKWPGKVAALVSGGVDSGLVAALLAKQCPTFEAFSIGTPWGNEFDDAQQLADAIGRPLNRVELDPQSILLALPQTVRAFGHAHPQAVEIGVAISAFCRQLTAGHLIFTGYGSDLINSGLATGDGMPDDIRHSIAIEVNKTRYSSELTSLAAQACGSELAHPYWDQRVLRTALDTCPSVKTTRGREKGHLRLAAERWLPAEAAWRKKTAIHHGNGLGAALSQLIDDTSGQRASAPAVYRQLLVTQLEQATRTPLSPLSAQEILDRALHSITHRC